jgi:adenylate cyclase
MTSIDPGDTQTQDKGALWRERHSAERAARLWSGVILMVFATSHFLNHALGVFGVDAMTAGQTWRTWVWRSSIGTVVLGGAALVHAGLALKRAAARRTWRMPPLEALQIILGLLIPFLILSHVVATRVVGWIGGSDDGYLHVLRNLWPGLAWSQSLALIVVWAHGVIGIHSAFHTKAWFKPLQVPLAILAMLIPALALAGFIAAGREAVANAAPYQPITQEQFGLFQAAAGKGALALYAVLALVASVVAFRVMRTRFAPSFKLRYLGHGEVKGAYGQSVLEVSRSNGIPHPSACGGRGRCSSCRVLILEGQDVLSAPSALEKRLLDRIRAPKNVRLACQIRPNGSLSLRVLLGTQFTSQGVADGGGSLDWGVEANLTILSADIRGFAALARNQLPADLIPLLNSVIGEMAQAVEARGGRIAMVQTDGVMAVFGMGGNGRSGSRAALDAAADMLKAVHLVNKDIGLTLPLPIRIGIGIHTGEAILAQTHDSFSGQRLVVIGEAAVVASRLEEATKELAADCVVSAATLATAGLTARQQSGRQIHYKNGAVPAHAHAFGDRRELQALLGRKAPASTAAEAASAQA